MHEWLESLRKSAKASQPGVFLDELRRAETESGIPLPEDLLALYQALDGGEFLGEVRLFPLRAAEGQPSVLEKTRLKLVGLPAAGVWRFGLKGAHRNLFTARKAALVEQGDAGLLPGWLESLEDEDWLFGTWDAEKRELRLFRSLEELLAVLVPPPEEGEWFGEKTFARALSAMEGALHALAHPVREALAERGLLEASPKKASAKKAPAKKTGTKKAPARKVAAKKAAPKRAAKKASAKKAPAKKASAKKAGKKKAPARKVAAKKAAKKAAPKRAAKKKASARKSR
ncbi:SMI1/KNR4 family protein [Myxococcaceae bacterium GXIMD 01537]